MTRMKFKQARRVFAESGIDIELMLNKYFHTSSNRPPTEFEFNETEETKEGDVIVTGNFVYTGYSSDGEHTAQYRPFGYFIPKDQLPKNFT